MNLPESSTALDAVRITRIEGLPLVVVPSDYKLQNISRFEPAPAIAAGGHSIDTLDTLLVYLKAHHVPQTAIFAHRQSGKISAIIDGLESDEPGWGRHTAEFALKLTPEWLAWNSINGKQLRQVDLAEFLEENHDCIHSPAPTDVIAAVNTLSGKRNITFESSRKLENGDVSIVWKEDTQTGGSESGNNKFPGELVLHIPVYDGAEKSTTFAVRALLRYRINEGKLAFEVKLIRPDKAIDEAFDRLVTDLEAELSKMDVNVPVYLGKITQTTDAAQPV